MTAPDDLARTQADLRTRIEALADEWEAVANTDPVANIGCPGGPGDYAASILYRVKRLRAVLDADTQEVAPEQCGAPAGTCPHGVCRKTMGDPYGCGGCCACLGGCQERPDALTTAAPALVEQIAKVLVYHQRRDIGSCICGWGVDNGNLGQSHAAHVARLVVEARPWQGEVEAARRDTPARPRPPADTDTGR